MFLRKKTNKSIGSSSVADKEIEKEYMSDMIKEKIEQADAVIIGAGAGLSTSAGYVYSGERFDKYFGDFKEKYNLNDMYSGGFYPYKTLEEYWGYWCRYIYVNRYMDTPKPLYSELLELVQGKNYFVLTTNVDHCFQKAGFDKERLFYTQGDYGLFQCCKPCHNDTYDNEDAIRKMVLSQGFKISDDNLIAPEKGSVNMTVPSDLIPKCPECGRPMGMNLRADNTFAEDDGWHRAAERYRSFLWNNKDRKVLFIELGVGYNTTGIIKYPFWQYTQSFKDAFYICVNKGEIEIPDGIKDKSICIDSDISKVIET